MAVSPRKEGQDLISKCGPGQMRMVLARTQTVTIGRIRQQMRLSELAPKKILAGPIPAFRLRADKNGTSIALAAANSKFKHPDCPRVRMVRGHRHFEGRPAGREDWMEDGGPRRNLAPPLNIDIAAKRRKKHKNQISGFVNSMCYNGQNSMFDVRCVYQFLCRSDRTLAASGGAYMKLHFIRCYFREVSHRRERGGRREYYKKISRRSPTGA